MISAAATLWDGSQHYWNGEYSGLRALLEDESVDKVFHHQKFDTKMLKKAGFKIRGRCWDTIIFGHLLNSRQDLSLEAMSVTYLPSDRRKIVKEITDWFDNNGVGKNERYEKFGLLPPEMLKRRNVGDTGLTMDLFKRLYVTVARTFPKLLAQEHDLIWVVQAMEDRGVEIDYDEIERQKEEFKAIEENVIEFCEGVVGRNEFNINSKADQMDLLEKAGILHLIKGRTDGGKKGKKMPKLDDWNLRTLHHPVSHMLLMGKAAHKMYSTFLTQMEREAVNGVLHPNYNACGTVSSRFSCTKPNLQNIPIEGDRRTSYTAEEAAESFDLTGMRYAPHLKRIFKVRPGYCHIHSDKKQAEMAFVAEYTGDQTLMQIFNRGENFHEGVCKILYKEVTKGLKTRTKAVVFGFIFGAGDFTLSMKIGSNIAEAKRTRRQLEQSLPSLPRWRRQLAEEVSERGYVMTRMGRRLYLHSSENYMAVNRMCQSSVADEVKSRMVAIHDALPHSQLLLNIHDDLATEVPIEHRHQAAKDIYEIMHQSGHEYKLKLPASLDITYTRWSDLVEITDPNVLPEPEPHHLNARRTRTYVASTTLSSRPYSHSRGDQLPQDRDALHRSDTSRSGIPLLTSTTST